MKIKPATIIQIPHPHLRRVAKQVPAVTPQMLELATKLSETLRQTKNPTGVGLAAPQIDQDWRMFATQIEGKIELFFNPFIVKHSQNTMFGKHADDPDLEGCLSIPKLYGAVPRWSWVDLEYDKLDGTVFKHEQRRFTDFPARVVQHEFDHLEGILFIDYSLKFDLPIYSADSRSDEMTEVPREIFITLHHTTLVQP